VLFVEHDHPSIPWLEPRDLELNDALSLLGSEDPMAPTGHMFGDFFYEYSSGRNVALTDGSVRFITNGVRRAVWSALLGVDDGIAWDDADLAAPTSIVRRPKIGNWIRLGIFFAVMLFPLPWVWLNPSSEPRKRQ
jgi:hypothetical protein